MVLSLTLKVQAGGAEARRIQSFLVWPENSFKGRAFIAAGHGERARSRLPASLGDPAYTVGLSLGQGH